MKDFMTFILIIICNLSYAQSLSSRLTENEENEIVAEETFSDINIPTILTNERTIKTGYRGPVEIPENKLIDLQVSGVIEDSVIVRVNGFRQLPGSFIIFEKTGNTHIKLLDSYSMGSYVEIEFKYTNDINNIGVNYLSSQLNSLSSNSPLKIYYGTNDKIVYTPMNNSLFSNKNIEKIIQGDRQEFGFSFTDSIDDFTFTYGTVSNIERKENSYRDEFITNNILNSGNIYVDNLSQDRSNNAVWREFSYGIPNESKIWYQYTYFTIDEQYQTIPSSGASSDMAAFLNDAQNWGGRSLMQPWYTSSMYSNYWGKNLDPKKGRSELNQFSGITYSYQGYGFKQFDDRIQYSSGVLKQEQTETLTEKTEDLKIDIPETGSIYNKIVRNMHIENPARLNEFNEIIQQPENIQQEYTNISLTQRLTDNSSISYNQEKWETTDFISGIESPMKEINRYSINNLGILGAGLTYHYTTSRIEGLTESEKSIRNLIIENMSIGSLFSSNIYIKDNLDYMGNLFYRNISYNIDPIQFSPEFNISGFRYKNEIDNYGSSYISKLAQLNGEIFGIQWNANIDNSIIEPGFINENNQNLNDTESIINRQIRNINLSRQFNNIDFKSGYNDYFENNILYNKTYYIAGRYQNNILNGNLYLHMTQYRNIDKFGTMRPSYDYMATYNKDELELGFRRYQHFGTTNEFSFNSDTYWLNYAYKNFNFSSSWRHNPILIVNPNNSPQIYLGDTQQYNIKYNNIIDSINIDLAVSLVHNGLPTNNFYSQEWPGIAYYGNLESKIPAFYNWNSNWESIYSLGISFKNGNSLTLSRTNTRFNISAINQITWDIAGTWKISDKDNLIFIYKNWNNIYPRYCQEKDEELIQGESYTIKYTRFSEDSLFSLGIIEIGPLNKYLTDKSILGNQAQQFYQIIPNLDKELKWFAEFKLLF